VNVRKTLTVARREFTATVLTRGFVIGVVIMPVIVTLIMGVLPRFFAGSPVTGAIALVDRSGRATAAVTRQLAEPRSLEAEGLSRQMAVIRVEPRPADAAVDAETQALRERLDLLAVVVIPQASVATGEPFEVYASQKLDVILEGAIVEAIGDGIVDTRLEESGLDAARVRELTKRPEAVSRTVTALGQEETNAVLAMMLPAGFMMLLWIATFTAGQFLLTTLVEEKSARVMEVLLSAVSPLELMTGKILGQAGVGLLVLAMYALVGLSGLAVAGLSHLVSWPLLLLLLVFFVIAFLLVASMMAAIGSVVDDLRTAQSLVGPAMLVVALPTMLWFPITRAPNSTVAVALSFIPPIGPFVTVLRIAGREPVPAWQVALSVVVGVVSVAIAIRAAARIFRIGVLMYGKPPSLRTLLAWSRRP
jgi:ABC-2 type transport system permease protein